MEIFNVQEISSDFTLLDVVLVLALSFVLSAFIGWIYKITHRGTSYTQSFVFSLVLNCMVVALVMMIIGSSIARAFSLVGALSIIRFRNAVKETRDVAFIFFSMVIGMALGTRLYALAVIGTAAISLVGYLLTRFDWFAWEMSNQILRVQIPGDAPFDSLFDQAFLKYTRSAELISMDSVHNDTLIELTYSIGMKKSNRTQDFLSELRKLNGNHKITLIAGYNNIDL